MNYPDSLKSEVDTFGRIHFKELFPNEINSYVGSLLRRLRSKYWGLLAIVFTIFCFAFGQIFHPKFLQMFSVTEEISRIIIDQRSTNLATIFSISLVVIGWLITNISIKETISYELLFKKTYIYPIFYFIVSLIGAIMLSSLFRNEKWFNLPHAVITATYLILLALIAITFLFIRLLSVVGSTFFYKSLESEVMQEVRLNAKQQIYFRKSEKCYKEYCEYFGFIDGIVFGTDLSQHKGVNITPLKHTQQSSPSDISNPFHFNERFQVKDINILKLWKALHQVTFSGQNYFRILRLGNTIPENFHPFYFHNTTNYEIPVTQKIKKAFSLRKPRQTSNIRPNLDHLCERFEKDVADGKKENVEMALAIFSKIFDLENKIIKEC